MKTCSLIFIVSLICSMAQGQNVNSYLISIIDKDVNEIDSLDISRENIEWLRTVDMNGHEVEVSVFFIYGLPTKLRVNYFGKGWRLEKVFYMGLGELLFLEIKEFKGDGIPRWEEAKAREIEINEIERVKVTRINSYYFYKRKVIESSERDEIGEASEYLEELNFLLKQFE